MGTMERLVKLKEYVDTNNKIPCDFKGDTKVINELLKRISELEFEVERQDKEIERLKSITKEIRHYIKDSEEDGYKLVWIDKEGKYFEAGISEILDKGSDK